MPASQWEGFRWMNEPRKWSLEEDRLVLITDTQTDFWRVTHYDFVKNDGHFFYREIKGPFTCQLQFSGTYRDLYDQAGLMLRLDDSNWIKAGIEYVSGRAKASTVLTRDFSDWSVRELKEVPIDFWVRAKRERDYVEVSFSTDSENFETQRLAYFPPGPSLQVGIMAASPKGQGFETNFISLEIKEG